jgi:salicylate hydroxylase
MGLDPDTAELHASGNTQIWCAPGRGVVAYPVARGALFNIAVSVPKGSGGFAGKWTDAGDVAEFRSLFSDFNPLVQKIASRVERCAQWTLAEIPELATWTSGKAVLLGDAAHAMSPMAAQGAAMAIEDAAVLGECLDSLSELAAVPNLLKRYEAIRRPRAERVVELARHNAIALTLPDGTEQQARDERWQAASRVFENTVAMREKIEPAARSRPKPDMNQKWGQPGLMMWLYGFDTIEDAKARQD